MIKEPKGYWRVFHSFGCDKVAFYVKTKPEPGGYPVRTDVINVDGSQPEPMKMAVCGSCGENLELNTIRSDEATFIE